MTRPTIGSFCTGYGGLDLAAEAFYDATLAWYSEIEPAPCRILEHHYPGVPNLGDLTAVDYSQVEPVDILTAGYPCQPFSHAGQRKGTDDVRHIWPHIAHAIGVLRPRHVVLENVAGHLSLGGPSVIADLAGLGYDARWMVVRAADVGACHRRARLFIVAEPADTDDDGFTDGHERSQIRRRTHNTEQTGMGSRDAPDAGGNGRNTRTGLRDGTTPREPELEDRLGLADNDRRAAVPDADGARPQRPLTDATGHPAESSGDPATEPDRASRLRRLQPGMGTRQDDCGPSGRSDRPAPLEPEVEWGEYGVAVARHAAAVGRPAPNPVDDRRRLNPAFVEWMMMLPAGWVTGVPGLTRTQQLKALGNGVVPPQAFYALHQINTVYPLDAAGV